jgi:ribonuclease D
MTVLASLSPNSFNIKNNGGMTFFNKFSNFMDVQEAYGAMRNDNGASLKNMVHQLLGIEINKSKSLTMSNWE